MNRETSTGPRTRKVIAGKLGRVTSYRHGITRIDAFVVQQLHICTRASLPKAEVRDSRRVDFSIQRQKAGVMAMALMQDGRMLIKHPQLSRGLMSDGLVCQLAKGWRGTYGESCQDPWGARGSQPGISRGISGCFQKDKRVRGWWEEAREDV